MEKAKAIRRYFTQVLNKAARRKEREAADFAFKTDIRNETFSVSWCVENMHRCSLKKGEYLESPPFSTGFSSETKWTLRIYPRSRNISDSVGLFIHKIAPGALAPLKLKYQLAVELCQGVLEKKKETVTYPSEGFFVEAKELKDNESSKFLVISSEAEPNKDAREYGTDAFMSSINCFKELTDVHICCHFGLTYIDDGEAARNCIAGFSRSCLLYKDLKEMYENAKFSDVTLQVQDKKFPAHKAILASRSKVFDAMFEHNMKEAQTSIVEVDDIEPAVMSNLLLHIYTGTVDDFDAEKAMPLFSAADKYCLEELKKWCVEIMLASLTVENVCHVAILADKHSEPKLKLAILHMFRRHKHEILQKKEWKAIMQNPSYMTMASDILQAVSEDFTTRC